jgi:hypothetical protein
MYSDIEKTLKQYYRNRSLPVHKMNKIDQTTYSHLTKSQLTQLRKACKIANLDFKAMACRPKDGLQLIKDVENRTGVKL